MCQTLLTRHRRPYSLCGVDGDGVGEGGGVGGVVGGGTGLVCKIKIVCLNTIWNVLVNIKIKLVVMQQSHCSTQICRTCNKNIEDYFTPRFIAVLFKTDN